MVLLARLILSHHTSSLPSAHNANASSSAGKKSVTCHLAINEMI